MTTSRVGPAACPIGTEGGVLVAGGYSDFLADPLCSVEVYCPLEERWTPRAPMEQKRYGLVLLAHGEDIYAIGGSTGMDVCATVEKYSAKQDCWTSCPDMPEALALYFYCVGGKRTIEVV